MYNHITLKELRPKLPKVIEQVDTTLERFIITKRGDPVAVLLSIDDFEGIIETLNEISDLENLKEIRKSMDEVKKGQTVDWEDVKKKYNV